MKFDNKLQFDPLGFTLILSPKGKRLSITTRGKQPSMPGRRGVCSDAQKAQRHAGHGGFSRLPRLLPGEIFTHF
jgi:hypothetical protein